MFQIEHHETLSLPRLPPLSSQSQNLHVQNSWNLHPPPTNARKTLQEPIKRSIDFSYKQYANASIGSDVGLGSYLIVAWRLRDRIALNRRYLVDGVDLGCALISTLSRRIRAGQATNTSCSKLELQRFPAISAPTASCDSGSSTTSPFRRQYVRSQILAW